MIPVLVASSRAKCFAFPDVCKTPTPAGAVPIPYPNIAMGSQASGAKRVKVQRAHSVLRQGDKFSMSTGDEAGVGGNVVSQKFKGKCEVMGGWPKVRVEGKKIAFQTVPMGQNGGSGPGALGGGVDPGQSGSAALSPVLEASWR